MNTYVRRVAVVMALAVALVLAAANLATAQPVEPTLDAGALRALIDASPSGSVDGYFKTVVKGTTVVEIPAKIMAVVAEGPQTSLILFESDDPIVISNGGIASGMSGSPLYVEDGAVDPLVGAVSYGDYFTLRGTGLATPVGEMQRLETLQGGATVTALDEPVIARGTVVDRVIVSNEPERYADLADEGALVAKPLAGAFIGGVSPSSPAYKLLAAALETRGFEVSKLATPLSSGSFKASAAPVSIQGGSATAALAVRGDVWVGGLGTITYINGNNVLAFGHPLFGLGDSSLYMMDAWIDGIWPTTMSPYKMGYPSGAPRGVFTQDRATGALAVDGASLAETAVTSTATRLNASGGAVESTTSAAYMPSAYVNGHPMFSSFVPGMATLAGSVLYDQSTAAGSALTTTTIAVSDGTKVHRIQLTDVLDSSTDIVSATAADVLDAMNQLSTVTDSGIYADDLNIVSIDISSTISPKRRSATIADVTLPAALKVGTNTVRVSLLRYGVAATQTVDIPLTIPAGTPLTGKLAVGCRNESDYGMDIGSSIREGVSFDEDYEGPALPDRRTIEQIVADVNEMPTYDQLIVTYVPSSESSDDEKETETTQTPDPIVKLQRVDSFLKGSVSKQVSSIAVKRSASTVSYGRSVTITGTLSGPSSAGSLTVYATPAGESERKVETLTPELSSDTGAPGYVFYAGSLKKNTTFRFVFAGDSSSTYAETSTAVKVRAKASAKTSSHRIKRGKTVKLTATVSPKAAAGSRVAFEYYSKRYHGWRTIAQTTLKAGSTTATASHTWRIRSAGSWRARVRFLGGSTNTGQTSSVVYIRVTK